MKSSPPEYDISICIATFRRPQKLQRLLQSLATCINNCSVSVEIIIVDNDADKSAENSVNACRDLFTKIEYLIEPRQNISHARNLAVASAKGAWLAFIDDDETAEPHWLTFYWDMVKSLPAEGYFGPVMPSLEKPAAFWFNASLFLSRPRFKDGTILTDKMRTGNAFIKKEVFYKHQFDPAFGLTGGGDAAFFEARAAEGRKFIWNDRAITYEYYPAERTHFRWLVLRYFRSGLAYSRIRLDNKTHTKTKIIVKAFAVSLFLAFTMPLRIFRSPAHAVLALLRIILQAGHIAACFNLEFYEYKK